MKKAKSLLVMLVALFITIGFVGCGTTKYDINFMVDGQVYATIESAGEENLSMPANPTKENYVFDGWYFDDETFNQKFSSSKYINEKLTENITVYAKWTAMAYTITYNLNGGTNNPQNPSSYTIETETITLKDPSQSGSTFAGWFSESTFTNKVTQIVKGSTGNKTLYAKWITIFSGNSRAYTMKTDGSIDFGSYPQTKVTDNSLVSSLTNLAGTKPSSSNSADWISYKYYIGNEENNSANNSTDYMWYKDIRYNDEKYRAIYFTSYRPNYTSNPTSYTYQDDNGYNTNTLYFFKYEPINWRILTESNGKVLLMCNMILDSQEYYHKEGSRDKNGSTVFANNYAESNIRKWLNDNFYNTAFNDLQKKIIQLTNVDNSERSTTLNNNPKEFNNGKNSYACANTNDYVFLLSEQEATNPAYGFNPNYNVYDTKRQLKGTDYAKSQGLYIFHMSSVRPGTDCSYWWLRSPYCSFESCARRVYYDGYTNNSDYVSSTSKGVVPVLWITL